MQCCGIVDCAELGERLRVQLDAVNKRRSEGSGVQDTQGGGGDAAECRMSVEKEWL